MPGSSDVRQSAKGGKQPAYDLGDAVPARSATEDDVEALPGDGPVPVRAVDGKVGTIDRGQLAQALDAGAQVVDDETLRKAQLEADYGGAGGAAIAGAAGVARGLTLGTSDLAARYAGGSKLIHALDAYKEANPTASTVGEVGGAVLPLIASDGVAGIAGTAVRGAAETGELAGAGARALVGEGGGFLARTARGAAEYGARGAAEGALYGAGEHISEESLGDRDVNAENLFAAMGKGALFGGAIGAGQGALHGAAGAAAAGIGRVASSAANKAGELVDGARGKLGELYEGGRTTLGGLVDSGRSTLSDIVDAAPGTLGELGDAADAHAKRLGEQIAGVADATKTAGSDSTLGKLSQSAEDYADEAAYRTVSSGRGQTALARQADQKFGGTKALGRIWREDVPALAGEGKTFSQLTVDDMADAAKKGMNQEGAKLNAILDDASPKAHANLELPKAMEIVNHINGLAKTLEDTTLGNSPAVAKLRQIAGEVEHIQGLRDSEGVLKPGAENIHIELRQLRNMRRDIDKVTFNNSATELKGFKKQFQEVRNDMEGRIQSLVEKYGDKDAYQLAKKKFQAFEMLDRASEMAKASSSGNRFFGLGDTLTGGVGAAMGGMVAGVPGAFVGNMAGKAVGRFSRERGSYYAAEYLSREGQQKVLRGAADALGDVGGTFRKLEQMEAVQRVKSALDSEMADSVKAALSPKVDAARDAATGAAEGAKRAAKGAYEGAKSAAEGAYKSVSESASGAIESAGESIKAAGHAAREGVDRLEQVQRQMAAIQGAAQNPELLHAQLEREARGLSDLPETRAALTLQASTAIAFLASRTPKPLPSGPPLNLGPSNKARSPYDVHQLKAFESYVRATSNPMTVIHDLKTGRATREGVEAVKAVYPRLYNQMTTAILHELADQKSRGKSPPYAQRLQLGIVLGQPTDWSLEPDSVKLLQSAASGSQEEQAPGAQAALSGPARPLSPIAVQDSTTTTEKLGAA